MLVKVLVHWCTGALIVNQLKSIPKGILLRAGNSSLILLLSWVILFLFVLGGSWRLSSPSLCVSAKPIVRRKFALPAFANLFRDNRLAPTPNPPSGPEQTPACPQHDGEQNPATWMLNVLATDGVQFDDEYRASRLCVANEAELQVAMQATGEALTAGHLCLGGGRSRSAPDRGCLGETHRHINR